MLVTWDDQRAIAALGMNRARLILRLGFGKVDAGIDCEEGDACDGEVEVRSCGDEAMLGPVDMFTFALVGTIF